LIFRRDRFGDYSGALVLNYPAQNFAPEDDNIIHMYIEFGMTQKCVDDLSKNAKGGLKTKFENG